MIEDEQDSANEGEEGENSEGAEQSQQWYWAEGVPGTGPRPDYLPEKFTSVADAAKARSDLEKKLGNFTGAPEKYNIENMGVEQDHTLTELMGLGKELNMSQAGFEKLVGKLMSAQEAENNVTLEEEVTKLGEEGPRLMRQYKNFSENHLQPEEQELVKGWIKSADDLKVFNAMVKGIYGKRLPTDNSMYMGNGSETSEQIKQEMTTNIERYKTDKHYREDIRNRLGWAQKRADRNSAQLLKITCYYMM